MQATRPGATNSRTESMRATRDASHCMRREIEVGIEGHKIGGSSMTTRADIDDFLALQRIAMVGVSRNSKDFSRTLFRDLCDRGYDVVPVNLFVDEIAGQESFQCLQVIR